MSGRVLPWWWSILQEAWIKTWKHPWVASGAIIVPPLVSLAWLSARHVFDDGYSLRIDAIGPLLGSVGVGVFLFLLALSVSFARIPPARFASELARYDSTISKLEEQCAHVKKQLKDQEAAESRHEVHRRLRAEVLVYIDEAKRFLQTIYPRVYAFESVSPSQRNWIWKWSSTVTDTFCLYGYGELVDMVLPLPPSPGPNHEEAYAIVDSAMVALKHVYDDLEVRG